MRSSLIDGWLWQAEPKKSKRLLDRYLRGELSFPEFKIKLYYLKREVEKINQEQLEL